MRKCHLPMQLPATSTQTGAGSFYRFSLIRRTPCGSLYTVRKLSAREDSDRPRQSQISNMTIRKLTLQMKSSRTRDLSGIEHGRRYLRRKLYNVSSKRKGFSWERARTSESAAPSFPDLIYFEPTSRMAVPTNTEFPRGIRGTTKAPGRSRFNSCTRCARRIRRTFYINTPILSDLS